ncbi:hypothetical protein B0920_02085 [Massilia sp. KIM]|uniref:hypothetical protein n=1 Tax=Massilia sp. KIM TaxID=1955422 RepID=UPI00098F6F93|nr:hypothetical protein [Massilia sp. KIM]OON62290.1 hypothetical protein B0920_02085 [Massilia sp. KIM]
MAALTASRNTPMKDAQLVVFPVAANAKIFAGALVAINAAGFLVPGTVSTTLRYQGRANAFCDNTGGADGAKTVAVRRRQAFKFANHAGDPVAQADVGNVVYIVDDQTVAKTNGTGTRSAAGKLLAVEVDGVWIE